MLVLDSVYVFVNTERSSDSTISLSRVHVIFLMTNQLKCQKGEALTFLVCHNHRVDPLV